MKSLRGGCLVLSTVSSSGEEGNNPPLPAPAVTDVCLSPDTYQRTEEPTVLGAWGASTNAPSALDQSTLPPLKLKSGYAVASTTIVGSSWACKAVKSIFSLF